MISIVTKVREHIDRKVENGDPTLYVSIAPPILFTFVVTFIISRAISYLAPGLYLESSHGLHIHHFTYGVFIMFAAGYLGLVVRTPKAKFWVAVLLGLGLGLAMDEFGMWLRLRDDDVVRWSYDGFNITIGLFMFILTLQPAMKMLKKLSPRLKNGPNRAA